MAEQQTWLRERPGPASVAQVMADIEGPDSSARISQFRPLATGFQPLDEILNGGVRPGELMVVAGPYGVGKTIFALQMARNAVLADPEAVAIYICYEHDRTHLFSRLVCLESAEVPTAGGDAMTLRKLGQLAYDQTETGGLVGKLRRDPKNAPFLRVIGSYADRLVLARASGAHTTLDDIRRWVEGLQSETTSHVLVVVDYLQKVAYPGELPGGEDQLVTLLSHGLKEMALDLGVPVMAIAAADRVSLRGQRMRFSDLRGSSALQYESDVGIVLNNKYDIISREHLIYNLAGAETMRNWLVLTVEKNRAGRNAVDMEFAMDPSHFRILSEGSFVRERLIDGKTVLE